MPLKLHSTRLFPKNQGADQYKITGIAAECDWVVLTDMNQPHTHIEKIVATDKPLSIFLSLRAHSIALKFFAESVLPKLHAPFCLVSGSKDITLPNQTDKRWPPLGEHDRAHIQSILDSPLLKHWAVENLDAPMGARVMPLPIGAVFTNAPQIRDVVTVPDVPRLMSRPNRVLCAHRVRNDSQWDLRKSVNKVAQEHWAGWCTLFEEEITEEIYFDQICEHSFVLCVEGGGLDPSPKAWQAILHGAIPIIRKTALYNAYRQLPVVFVDDWIASAISAQKLERWRTDLAKYYDQPELRGEVLRRLGSEYWFEQVMNSTAKSTIFAV